MAGKQEKDLIKKLKLAMLEKGLNQSSLAKAIGLSHAAINAWLRGKSNPSLEALEDVAQATGKPINYFFSDDSTTQNIVGSHNTQHTGQAADSLKKEIELLRIKQEVQQLTIENLKLRLERLERKK